MFGVLQIEPGSNGNTLYYREFNRRGFGSQSSLLFHSAVPHAFLFAVSGYRSQPPDDYTEPATGYSPQSPDDDDDDDEPPPLISFTPPHQMILEAVNSRDFQNSNTDAPFTVLASTCPNACSEFVGLICPICEEPRLRTRNASEYDSNGYVHSVQFTSI